MMRNGRGAAAGNGAGQGARRLLAGAIALGLLSLAPVAATETKAPAATPAPTICATPLARLDANFPAAAAGQCATHGERSFTLTLSPEDAPPINCSPWYGFRLTPMAGKRQRIEIALDYTACGHRYWPKTSPDGVTWTPLPEKQVTLFEEDGRRRARFHVALGDAPLFVAGQEIIAPATYDAWLADKARHPHAQRSLLGRSAEGRDIELLTIAGPGAGGEQVLLLGRQHPPEITGALAMFHFVDAILSDDPVAKAYRARFTTLVVPMLNPDGVARGYWRHATGGLDLNRDWGPFTQPETRLVQRLAADIDADPARKLRLLLDFHSTRKDVIYTLTDDQATDPPNVTAAWIDRYQQRMPGYTVERDASHNAGLPTSKSWGYETYRIPTATFELGDETPRPLIARIGRQAALAMMEAMLATPRP
ncbi:M14 family metallopeptidase [Sphingopyxis sp. MWB1]|uniref:M14 family metallopeptidase n=1 Tax=Sphingopyxis sp. MWB1 TaxID=1537715 RepID=UPI00068E17C8|nr:M14 family metallopeptidase [Sphingopyxis sp. MWB1]